MDSSLSHGSVFSLIVALGVYREAKVLSAGLSSEGFQLRAWAFPLDGVVKNGSRPIDLSAEDPKSTP